MYRPVQQCDISVDKNIQTLQNNTQVRNKMSTSTADEDLGFMDMAAQLLNGPDDNEPIRRRLANMDSSDEENDDRRTVFSEYDNNSTPDLSSDYQLLEPPIPQQPPTQYQQQPQPPIQQPPTQYQQQPQQPIPQQPPTQYQSIQRQPQQPQPPIQQPPTQYQPIQRQPQQPQPPNNPVGNQTRTGDMDGLNIEDALEDLNDTSTNGPGVSNDRSIKPSSGNRIKLTADINSPSSNNNSGKHTRFSNNSSTDPNIPPSKRFKLPNPPNFNQNGSNNTKNQGGDVLDYKPVNMNTKPKIGAPNPPAGIKAPIDGFFGTQNNNGFQNMNNGNSGNNNGFQNMNSGNNNGFQNMNNSGNNNGFQNMNNGNNNGSQDLICAIPSNSASLRFGLNNSIPAYPYTTTCMNDEYAQSMIQALYQLGSHIIHNSIETIFIWDNTIVLGNAKKYGTSNRKPNIQIPSMLGNIKISRRNIANDDEMSIIMICPNETSGINQWVGLMYHVPEFKQAIDQFNAQMLVRWASFSNTTYEDALLKYVKLLNNYIMLNSDKSSYALLSARSLSSNNSNFNQNNGFQNMNSMNSNNGSNNNGFQNMNSGNNNGFQGMNNGSNNNGFQNMNSGSNNNGFQGMQSMNSNSNNQSMQGSKLLPEYTLWNSASSVNEQYAGTITDPNTSMIEYNPPILTQDIDCHQKYEIIRSFLENTDMKLVPRKKKSKKNSS